MVEGPDVESAIVVRCLAEEWGNEDQLGEGEEGPSMELRMQKGDIMIVRWRDVREGALKGDVELL